MDAPVLSKDLPPSPAILNRQRRWGWLIHLLVLGAYPIVIGLIGTKGGRPQSPALTHSTKGLLIVVGIQFVLFAVVFGVAWVASRATWQDLLCRWRGGFWIVPLSL